MNTTRFSQPEKWILIGIPALFLIGSVMHFLYDILWENPIVGLFVPVNESIWEHSKLVLWPVILWWGLYYCFRGNSYNISKTKWFTAALFSLVTALISMPMLYYFYTEAFGVQILWIDIIILLISLILGQLLGLHCYRHEIEFSLKIVMIFLGIICLLFFLFTFFPPHIPWLQDGVTGEYGIHIFQ